MHACMYVCMYYVCMYVRMHVCMYVSSERSSATFLLQLRLYCTARDMGKVTDCQLQWNMSLRAKLSLPTTNCWYYTKFQDSVLCHYFLTTSQKCTRRLVGSHDHRKSMKWKVYSVVYTPFSNPFRITYPIGVHIHWFQIKTRRILSR